MTGLNHFPDQSADRSRDRVVRGPPSTGSDTRHRRGELLRPEECGTLDPAERERTAEQDLVRLLAPVPLEFSREGRHGHQALPEFLDDQQQDSGSCQQQENGIEVVAPWVPCAPGPEERVVQMMNRPQPEGSRQKERCAGAGPTAVLEKDPSGPSGGAAQEQDRWDRCQQEGVELENGDEGPEDREQQGQEVLWPQGDLAGEDQGGPQQSQGGPAGGNLVPEEPDPAVRRQEGDDRHQAEGEESPGDRPPEEVGFGVPPVQIEEEASQAQRHRGLEQRGADLVDHEHLHGANGNRDPSRLARGGRWCRVPSSAWLGLMAQLVVMPMMGMGLFSSSMQMALGSLVGHLVYGAILGGIVGEQAVA